MKKAATPTPASSTVTGSHAFAIGQAVRVKRSYMFRPSTGVYYVTATAPTENGQPRYRVRNDGENHERIVAQDSLEPAVQEGTGKPIQRRIIRHG